MRTLLDLAKLLMLHDLNDLEYDLKQCENDAQSANDEHCPECEPRSRIPLILPELLPGSRFFVRTMSQQNGKSAPKNGEVAG